MGAEFFKAAQQDEEFVLRERDEASVLSIRSGGFAPQTMAVTLLVVLLAPAMLSELGTTVLAQENLAQEKIAADSATQALPQLAKIETPDSVDTNLDSAPGAIDGTRVSIPFDLKPLHRRGGVPKSLEQLRLMEKQQRRVAEQAEECTVSVRIGASQGCGVIITDKGYIVTAAHVAIRPGLTAIVTLSDGRQVRATTLGMNRHVDAGLIRINPDQNNGQPWPHATLGTSDDLVPGMWCVAMGHPGGYEASRGAVIRVGRLLEVRPDVIVTDCALIGGDSGGPLFNMAGELIAVHSRIGNDVADNLHVPIDHYDYSWEKMAASQAWGFLPNFKPTLGVSGNQGTAVATIIKVKEGSAAEAGGMKPGDVVAKFGTKDITDFQSLIDAVSDTMPGERVEVVVMREGRRITLTIEIGRSG